MKIRPFRDGDTRATFNNLTKEVIKEIEELDNEYVLKASKVELEEYFLEKVTITDLKLHSEEAYIEDRSGTKIDVSSDFIRGYDPSESIRVSGTKLDIAIPFEGDPFCWKLRPSRFSHTYYPELDIRDNEIVFSIIFPDDTVESKKIKSEIETNVSNLLEASKYINNDIEAHNEKAPQKINQAINNKISKAQKSLSVISDLDIPIKKRDKPLSYSLPTKRRTPPKRLPKVQKENYQPEPILDQKDYEHILSVLRSMSLVIERNPDSFNHLDEEDIRNHFLIQLNGHYEGKATGETFNSSGKTDILIRVNDKNVFIAECKFWRGKKLFDEAVSQLLGYLSWRDSKTAILVFNKNIDTSSVIKKMNEVILDRNEYRRNLFYNKDGESRYVLVKDSDPGKEITVTTMIFDLPK